MALIEVFHVVASELPIDANDTTDIPQGLPVTLNTDGLVHTCDGDTEYVIGIAGDSRSQGITSYTPESGSSLSRNPTTSLEGALVIGHQNPPAPLGFGTGYTQRYTQNRVADNYNEVLASGKMTVYHSGGEFWTDQYELIQSDGATLAVYTPGTPLYAAGTAETVDAVNEPEGQLEGRFTDEASTIAQIIGYTLTAPTAYPSGVPGTTVGFNSGLGGLEGGNSLSYGTFLHVKLSV